ncbi:ABC transporter permease [Quadrisphaera sp. DSM 44207]|uniref:ABC transporter permease n=1 Tax=Quadrisphaera sp. DSM 44207 TaxID=1881057 RepID=UPI00088F7A98|nr:ABC transporter permease [Quadrisphaera sp. DSM 44207]SDQ11909.1 nucleoside ABC transporter membrane protein [Quadrisphaera sp. DSM 44207]
MSQPDETPTAAVASGGEPGSSGGPVLHPEARGAGAWPAPSRLGTAGNTVAAVLLALLVGAVLIVVSTEEVQEASGYFFARPQDTLAAAWTAVSEAYAALFAGSVLDLGADSPSGALRPLTETLVWATPLVAGGLAVALAFRTGLFNIGVEGQIILAAIFAAYVGFALDLPAGLHLLLAVVAGVVGGALWGGVVGVLKATTGAHEVIVAIMLNYVARFLVAYLLTTSAFRREGRNDPISPPILETAVLPRLFGDAHRLHAGILLSLAAAVFVWWLLTRSTVGFRFRAVGQNPHAARTAGISVERSYTGVMLVCGGLAGLAGVAQVLGTERFLAGGVSSGLGFDAITVALLGRSSPVGAVAAGLLFGALRAGGLTMQARTGTSLDLVVVLQSLIVLFVAAPALVRALRPRLPRRRRRAAEPALAGGAR